MPFTVLNSFLYAVPLNPHNFSEIRKRRCREVKKFAKGYVYNLSRDTWPGSLMPETILLTDFTFFMLGLRCSAHPGGDVQQYVGDEILKL